jgi:prepilin-type N-terminal cleavage/methylation domain-containing protein
MSGGCASCEEGHIIGTVGAMRLQHAAQHGFTLIELMLVIGILAILAGVVIAALAPTRQLGFARDAKRQSDVNTILNGLYQYSIDHNGVLPAGIPASGIHEICRTGAADCDGANLNALSGSYLVSIPIDPRAPETGTGTSYFIKRENGGRMTVSAPLKEVRENISVTR